MQQAAAVLQAAAAAPAAAGGSGSSAGSPSADLSSDSSRAAERRISRVLVRNTPLFEQFIYIKRSFYQDRLGTNIGKTPKSTFFSGGAPLLHLL
jgi:hypothetical protein